MIREARPVDLDAIEKIYDNIHAAEESGRVKIGWISGVYPVRATAEEAIRRRDMFAGDDEVCVLHTLVVDPNCSGRGVGSRFVEFYEKYALSRHCTVLRIDTNAINSAARRLYAKLGYREADIVPCAFNGIPNVNLILLEKKLK